MSQQAVGLILAARAELESFIDELRRTGDHEAFQQRFARWKSRTSALIQNVASEQDASGFNKLVTHIRSARIEDGFDGVVKPHLAFLRALAEELERYPAHAQAKRGQVGGQETTTPAKQTVEGSDGTPQKAKWRWKASDTVIAALITSVTTLIVALLSRQHEPAKPQPVVSPAAISQTQTAPNSARSRITPLGVLASLDTVPPLREEQIARALYLGRPLDYTGRVSGVGHWPGTDSLLVAFQLNDWAFLQVQVPKSFQDILSDVRRGDTLHIIGSISEIQLSSHIINLRKGRIVRW